MDYILYFKVETLDEREHATSVLEETGFTCIDECGGQAAFEDGDFGAEREAGSWGYVRIW